MADQVEQAELVGNLHVYQEQLEAVSQLLLDDPENEEYAAIYENLNEVIQLARELQQASAAGPHAAQAPIEPPPAGSLAGPSSSSADVQAATSASLLPPQVEEQIRQAQAHAALTGHGPAVWAVNAKCRAIFSGDGNWYNATVQSVSERGGFVVLFDGYSSSEEVAKDAIQPRPSDEEGGYKPVAAPKPRKFVTDSAEIIEELPGWLAIKPTDSEATRLRKRKLAKAMKSKMRFAKMDVLQKQKADAWKNFLKGKGKTSKPTKKPK